MSIPNFQLLKGTMLERVTSYIMLLFSMVCCFLASTSFIWVDKPAADQFSFPTFSTDYLLPESTAIAQTHWRGKATEELPVTLFYFNPNTASVEDFMRLGLSQKLSNTIHNFRQKGGKFFKPEDLKKIYGLRNEDYSRLAPFIQISTDFSYSDDREYYQNKQQNNSFDKKQNTDSQLVAVLFDFNPNEASKDDFLRMGLSEKIAQRIVNYREKGGKFYKKEDLKKIYDITDALYNRLENHIVIPQSNKNAAVNYASFGKKGDDENYESSKNIQIDINQATIEEWQQLKGIGPGYAKKIVGYREKLGGFSSIAQIGETYYFPDSVFQKVKPFLQLSPVLKPIDINTISAEDLQKHPYFTTKQAKALVNYRAQHGYFQNMEDVKKIIGVFKPADWKRIEPYLKF